MKLNWKKIWKKHMIWFEKNHCKPEWEQQQKKLQKLINTEIKKELEFLKKHKELL